MQHSLSGMVICLIAIFQCDNGKFLEKYYVRKKIDVLLKMKMELDKMMNSNISTTVWKYSR